MSNDDTLPLPLLFLLQDEIEEIKEAFDLFDTDLDHCNSNLDLLVNNSNLDLLDRFNSNLDRTSRL